MRDYMDVDGRLLLALPTAKESKDINEHTLVFVRTIDGDRHFGLMLNRATDTEVYELLKTLGVPKGQDYDKVGARKVLLGGTENNSQMYILYEEESKGNGAGNARPVLNYSSSEKMLTQIVDGKGPSKYMLLVGNESWDKGDLAKEFESNCWINAPCDSSVLFDVEHDKRAKVVAETMGFKIDMIHA